MKNCVQLIVLGLLAVSAGLVYGQSIEPVSSKDVQVIVKTGSAQTGNTITLLSAKTSAACLQSKSIVRPQKGSKNAVRPGGETTLAVEKGQLKAGTYLCAVIKSSTEGSPETDVPAVQVSQAGSDPDTAKPAAGHPTISSAPDNGAKDVTIKTGSAAVGDKIALYTGATANACSSSTESLAFQSETGFTVIAGGTTTVHLADALKEGDFLCGTIDHDGTITRIAAVAISGPQEGYSEKTFEYLLLGGVEQADLSAQSSVTEGFYDLTMRERFAGDWGGIWFRSRYLGTPSSSSKQNIVAAVTNPSGTLTASNLPQSVTAVDYTLGYAFRDFSAGSTPNELTLTPVLGFGATTPLSATTIVDGFAVPAYGTNECNQLQQRFTAADGYNPALPGSGVYDSKGDMGCVVQPNPASTTSKPMPGTQIKDIGFSNEDRSSFLIKWGVGARVMDRWFVTSDPTTWCSKEPGCSRLIADFSIGQDEAITGGLLRHFVLKADAIIPIMSTGFYFFAASSNRLERNQTQSPLILSPVTLATNTVTSTCKASSTTVCFPSPNVFILPYKQQNRDYYRIGLGIDAKKIFTKLFTSTKPKSPTDNTSN